MNAERLLAVYEQISEAPDAIARLRRFVLDLAVRGKLVEQDAADEPASHLLIQIAAEKEAQIASRKKRSRKSAASTDISEVAAFSLPETWQWTTLTEVSHHIHYGFTASAAPQEKEYRLLRITDIQNDRVDWDAVPGCVIDEPTYEKYALQPNDLLIARTGGTIGKTFLVETAPVKSVFASYLIRVQPTSALYAQYIKLFCGSETYWDQLREGSRGGGQPNVNGQTLGKLRMPLPPRAEQHRIVAKVNELMALCDRLEEARKTREQLRDKFTAASLARLTAPETTAEDFTTHAAFALEALPALTTRPDQIKILRQTILNLAVRGKLVEQDPADEPASELLERFRTQKLELRRKTGDVRIKPAADAAPSELWLDLPPGWEVQSFENLFLFIDYRGKTPPKTETGIPLITAKNVRIRRLNREPREFIATSTFEKWMTRGFPRLGDIFFTTEAPLANACLNDIEEPFALAQRVVCLQPYAEINTRYLVDAMASDLVQEMIDREATGMTAKGIKTAKLKPLALPIPPLAEQHRIVAEVDALMALCDRLEAALTTADTTRTRLLEALLHEALEPAATALEAAE